MALDEALMESLRAGGPPVLRFYRWQPWCLSLGRNQPAAGLYDCDEIARRGLQVVRRATGGRAVLHAREVTYSAVFAEQSLGSLRESYAAINRALLSGVRSLGVPAMLQPRSDGRPPLPSTTPCFRDPAEGEVVVEGRKLIGSAQYRQRGAVLQHGSLLLADDQAMVAGLLLGVIAASHSPPGVLEDYCRPLPSWEVVTSALAEGWRREVCETLVSAEPDSGELDRAHQLQRKYANVEWIWRR